MKIKVINPNTTVSMTEKIGAIARSVANPETEIIACNPDMGSVSIEGHYDEALSVVGILDEIRKGETEGIDGYIIAGLAILAYCSTGVGYSTSYRYCRSSDARS